MRKSEINEINEFFNSLGIDNEMPVSYTHLDVYKRQEIVLVVLVVFLYHTDK